MSGLDVKLIARAHEAIFERGPVRDPHIETFRRYVPPVEVEWREEEPAEPRSDEQYFLDEQCPSDSFFGR